jgi:hypothetical protein
MSLYCEVDRRILNTDYHTEIKGFTYEYHGSSVLETVFQSGSNSISI